MSKKIILYMAMTIVMLSSCESLQRGLTGQKRNTSDEFLVEKKDPLVVPPNFRDLPNPDNVSDFVEEKEEIETFLSIKNTSLDTNSQQSSDPSSIEKSILKKINKN